VSSIVSLEGAMSLASIVALYLAIGAAASVVGPAGADIRDQHAKALAVPGIPRTKAMVLRAILMAAVVLLWPVLVPSAAKAVSAKQRQREPGLFELIGAMGQDGTDQDCIPGAVGPFGLCAENPIPTCSILGSTAYLARLRTDSGKRIAYSRRGSTLIDAIEHPIDVYDISMAGTELATLYVSPYHRRNSALAPDGFRLVAADGGPESRDEPAKSDSSRTGSRTCPD
jgi:hypothetical protein